MMTRLPLVIILGSTGTGKTKLSLELAQKFGGEIINADSMQVYKGLDIVTAKATAEERKVAPHHLLDAIEPHQEYNVTEFRNCAVKIIDDLFKSNKLPIVVGGTNYYIEALLWKLLVDNPQNNTPPNNKYTVSKFEHVPSLQLHSQLKDLDPDMAKRLHPNNKRKILRSLEIIEQFGKKHSEILKEQQSQPGASTSGGPLRYPEKSLVFWMRCEQEVLDKRLDERVDKMMEMGLLEELGEFHRRYNERRIVEDTNADYTKGIFQSIGFKEFHEYLILNEENQISESGKKLLEQGISDMKMVTRRYARKQINWVSHRFLGRQDRQVPPLYALDTTEPEKWPEKVLNPAIDVITSFINDSETDCVYKPLEKIPDAKCKANAADETFYCNNCERIFIGSHQYEIHVNSNKHKAKIRSKQKKNERMRKEKEKTVAAVDD